MKLATLNVTASRRIDFVKQLVPPLIWKAACRVAVVGDNPSGYAYDPHYSTVAGA